MGVSIHAPIPARIFPSPLKTTGEFGIFLMDSPRFSGWKCGNISFLLTPGSPKRSRIPKNPAKFLWEVESGVARNQGSFPTWIWASWRKFQSWNSMGSWSGMGSVLPSSRDTNPGGNIPDFLHHSLLEQGWDNPLESLDPTLAHPWCFPSSVILKNPKFQGSKFPRILGSRAWILPGSCRDSKEFSPGCHGKTGRNAHSMGKNGRNAHSMEKSGKNPIQEYPINPKYSQPPRQGEGGARFPWNLLLWIHEFPFPALAQEVGKGFIPVFFFFGSWLGFVLRPCAQRSWIW